MNMDFKNLNFKEMKRKILMLALMVGLFSFSGYSQSDEVTFNVSVSADSVYFGNKFKVTFTAENGEVNNFLQPEFADFQMASGQMMSSRMSIVNGQMSQMKSFSYYLSPKRSAGILLNRQVLKSTDRFTKQRPTKYLCWLTRRVLFRK